MMRFLTYEEAVARLLLGRVPLKQPYGLMAVHTVSRSRRTGASEFDGWRLDERRRALRGSPRRYSSDFGHYTWDAMQGDPLPDSVYLPDVLTYCAVEVDGAIRFLTREEFESMSNDRPIHVVLERDAGSNLRLSGAEFVYESDAVRAAEKAAESSPSSEFYVCRAITRSKRTAVTTTRLA